MEKSSNLGIHMPETSRYNTSRFEVTQMSSKRRLKKKLRNK
jgi:hypothetical protein